MLQNVGRAVTARGAGAQAAVHGGRTSSQPAALRARSFVAACDGRGRGGAYTSATARASTATTPTQGVVHRMGPPSSSPNVWARYFSDDRSPGSDDGEGAKTEDGGEDGGEDGAEDEMSDYETDGESQGYPVDRLIQGEYNDATFPIRQVEERYQLSDAAKIHICRLFFRDPDTYHLQALADKYNIEVERVKAIIQLWSSEVEEDVWDEGDAAIEGGKDDNNELEQGDFLGNPYSERNDGRPPWLLPKDPEDTFEEVHEPFYPDDFQLRRIPHDVHPEDWKVVEAAKKDKAQLEHHVRNFEKKYKRHPFDQRYKIKDESVVIAKDPRTGSKRWEYAILDLSKNRSYMRDREGTFRTATVDDIKYRSWINGSTYHRKGWIKFGEFSKFNRKHPRFQ